MAEGGGEETVGGTVPRGTGSGGIEAGGLPKTIGKYRILGKLGEGGMGVVYEAEQSEPRRIVALKVIRGGAAQDEAHVRMFQREVETLARLKHPGIGGIYESGRTEEGRHWFAMELVRGPDLSAYLAGRPGKINRQELEHRLRLAARIAEAVHYAHQRGVVHRDLKPSNIIVTGERSNATSPGLPEVKILDFGLARLTDEDLPAAETLTVAGAIKGTLPYMSPEQAKGDSALVDVRTDVYALGVVLYEMLTGRRPYDVARASLLEAVRVICEQLPQSMAASWPGERRLDADVETIVFKALEKEPDRRYGSAAALAEDLGRYLNSLPIMARPPSVAYQVRKFARRHRPLVAAAAASSLAVLGGLLVSTALYYRAERERAGAQAVAGFLSSMLEGVGAQVAQGRDTALLREILAQTTARIGRELGAEPEIEARLRDVMGNAYFQVTDFDQAQAQWDRALDLYRKVRGENHMDSAVQYSNLGLLAEARSDYPGAEQKFRRALEIARRSGADDPRTPQFAARLANQFVNQARYEEARALLEDALAGQRKIFKGGHADLAVTLNTLGNTYQYLGRLEEAEKNYREALAMHREVLGDKHPFVVTDLVNLAFLLDKRGQLAEAEAVFRDALARNRVLYPGGHEGTSICLGGLSSLLQRAGKYSEAEPLAREAVAMNETIYGPRSAIYARSLDSLGVLLAAKGEESAADEAQTKALEVRRQVFGPRHPDVASSLNNLGMRKLDAGRFALAEELIGQAVEIQVAAAGADSASSLTLMNNLARAREGRGDLAGAEKLFREVIDRRRRVLGHDNVYVAVSEYYLSRLLRDDGRPAGAEPLAREAAAIVTKALGEKHVQTTIMRLELAEVLTARGKLDEALSLARGIKERAEEGQDTPAKGALEAGVVLGRVLSAAGKHPAALKELEAVLARGEGVMSETALGSARIALGAALGAAGRKPEGREILQEVRAGFTAKYGPDHRIARLAAKEIRRLGG